MYFSSKKINESKTNIVIKYYKKNFESNYIIRQPLIMLSANALILIP